MGIKVYNVVQLLQSGLSKRWHNNIDMNNHADDLSQHQWSVAMILLYLNPQCSRKLLVEALTHDVGELIAGDLSYDFKINNEEISDIHKVAEGKLKNSIIETEDNLSDKDIMFLKFSDWISSYWWVAIHKPQLLNRRDWEEQKDYFIKLSNQLPKESHDRFVNFIEQTDEIATNGYSDKIDIGWVFGKQLKEYKTAA